MGRTPGTGRQLLAQGESRDRPAELRLPQAHADNQRGVDQRRDNARQEAAEQQLADRFLDDNRVDDQDRRGRDQRGQRAARRDDAGRQLAVIAVLEHVRDRDPGEHGRGGGRRAGDRGETGGREHRRHGEAARHPAGPAARRLKQLAGHAGVEGEKADQDEQRQHREWIGDGLGMRNRARNRRRHVPSRAIPAGRGSRSAPRRRRPGRRVRPGRSGKRPRRCRYRRDRGRASGGALDLVPGLLLDRLDMRRADPAPAPGL